MASRKTPPKAKPAKRVDRRKTTSTRIKPEVRKLLEEAAAQSGRSLAQEMELCLEQFFVKEDARDREFGGKELRGLFRMMAGALEIIEQGRGSACADDWGTFSAIAEAWQTLVFMGLAPKDQSFDEHWELRGKPSESLKLPIFPTPPKYPASKQEQRAYDVERKRWNNAAAEFQKKVDATQQQMAVFERLGQKMAIKMLYTGDQD